MADQLLELAVVTFTADELTIRVKNTSGTALDKRLVLELFPPAYLVDDKINEAAVAAASSERPPGAKSLAGVVSGPERWSIWVRREASDSSLVIVFINDMDQNAGDQTPVQFPAGAEFTIRIPLDTGANRDHIDLLYGYQHGKDERDPSFNGKLELKPAKIDWSPDVTLSTTHDSPTMINPGDLVHVCWKIKDGVSATLRGPLPGGNSELTLSPNPTADFKISEGSVEVRVMGGMTYLLQAEVKRPNHPNVQVVRMLWLDTPNHKYSYVYINPEKVLPHGLLEINWAAWGVKEIELDVRNNTGTHTTRTIRLTQQTKGRFFEGSGVMRVTATKTASETVDLIAPPIRKETTSVSVVSWKQMIKPDLTGKPLGMAIVTPKLAVLTTEGLSIAEIGEFDPESTLEKLQFSKVSKETPRQWLGLTAVDKRFVVLRRLNNDDLEVAPYKVNGTVDEIPPLTLPAYVRPLVAREGTTFDFVGFGGRVYVVIESTRTGTSRSAFSVAFNSATKKAEYRPEPLLEQMLGFRLVTFDDALYALNRTSGRMFRFELTRTGTLDEPRPAASAITEVNGQKESMIRQGLFVPIGRVLAVLSPSSVPTLAELQKFGLQNVLGYSSLTPAADPNRIPQDLVYNPQKNYWARCGHDLDVKTGAVAAFRETGSRRVWVIQPEGETHTLPAGSESLFAHDYVLDVPTAALPPYLNKKKQFKITNNTNMRLLRLSDRLPDSGLDDFSADGPAELVSEFPNGIRNGGTETFEFRYNEADPTPAKLRFLVQPPDGVIHNYFLEVTFSGPDLGTATSVFKRLADAGKGTYSLAEIPGTVVQHATNTPVVIPKPYPLLEGPWLKVSNATTFQLWKRASHQEERFFDNEVQINYETPNFVLFAYGAGEVPVDVDFSLPPGIEMSSSRERQHKLIRINTDRAEALQLELLPGRDATHYELKVRYVLKSDVNGVYLGDGMPAERGEAIYLPIAMRDNQLQTQVIKINPDNLSVTPSQKFAGKGVFSAPSDVAVTPDYILANFGDNNDTLVFDSAFQYETKLPNPNYTVICAIKSYYDSGYCLLVMKEDKRHTTPISFHYSLVRRSIGKDHARRLYTSEIADISLDKVTGFRDQAPLPQTPYWVAPFTGFPMSLSPSIVSTRGERTREAAVGIYGGLFVVGGTEETIRKIGVKGLYPEAIVYGREGKEIFSAHSLEDRVDRHRRHELGLQITRIDNVAWKETHSVLLPRGEDVIDLTRDTEQRNPMDLNKPAPAASMVRTLDGKRLFVSHGRTIFVLDSANLTVLETYKVDLPCRLLHVWSGRPVNESHPLYGSPSSCILLYAIGSSYSGDGAKAKGDFVTRLYKLGIPF